MPNSEIREIYEKMVVDRRDFDKKMGEVQDLAKTAQDAFNGLVNENSDLGAGVILPILRCITSHVLKVAGDRNLSKDDKFSEISSYLAPMIAMHYDVYTHECIENIDEVLNEEDS
jgi:hypothetical protein